MAFDLSSIHRGFSSAPPRVVVYGDHGVGKSTFKLRDAYPKASRIQRGLMMQADGWSITDASKATAAADKEQARG